MSAGREREQKKILKKWNAEHRLGTM